jgi:AcrR family transcriptional regulator
MAAARNERDEPRRLPRGRHALSPEEVQADQRRRLIEAVPGVVAARGYEATSVADIVKAAAVSRNAFYASFSDKEACFAAAHEACQEGLLAALKENCDRRASFEERLESALGRAFDLFAADPDLARLIFVEAPAAGDALARRYYEWLRDYGSLLRAAVPSKAEAATPPTEMDQVIVGGLASRIAGEVLEGRAGRLRRLTPHALDYVLAFYGERPADAGEDRGASPPAAPRAEAPPRRRAAS